MKILNKIQKELKAPKGNFNSFGKYNYRSCEDILEAVKPLLDEAILTISDEIINVGDRYYIKATATISQGEEKVSVSAFARESLDKKGMDDAQITGSASSYARKYALNGLFCIDDTKDDDYTNNGKEKVEPKTNYKAYSKPKEEKIESYNFEDFKKRLSVLKTDAQKGQAHAYIIKSDFIPEEEKTVLLDILQK